MYLKVNYPTTVRKKITVKSFAGGMVDETDEKVSDLSKASLIYNFDYSSGVLKSGTGASPYSDNYTMTALKDIYPAGIHYYKRFNQSKNDYEDRLIYFCSDNHLYYVNLKGGEFKKIEGVFFVQNPLSIHYNYLDKDVLLLTNQSKLYYLDDETLYEIKGAPIITSLCVHKERVFVTTSGDGTSLWFSDDFNPTNWAISLNEAGFIKFSDDLGKLLKVVSFLDYVYVFREYGISRVTAYGDQEEFATDNLYGKVGKIFGNSVTDVGDYIVMITSSGIYKFNGLDSTKILGEFDRFLQGVDNTKAKGVYHGNNLYYKLNMKFDGNVETVFLTYNTATNKAHISRNMNINDIVFCGGNINKVMFANNIGPRVAYLDSSGTYLQVPSKKEWISAYSDLGVSGKNKFLQKVSIYTKNPITLTVTCDNKQLVYKIKGGGYNEVYPSMKGELFRVSIQEKTSSPEIYNLSLYVEYVKESF